MPAGVVAVIRRESPRGVVPALVTSQTLIVLVSLCKHCVRGVPLIVGVAWRGQFCSEVLLRLDLLKAAAVRQ